MPPSTNISTFTDIKSILDSAIRALQNGVPGVKITMSDVIKNGEKVRDGHKTAIRWRHRAHRFRALYRQRQILAHPDLPAHSPYDGLYFRIDGPCVVITTTEREFSPLMTDLDGRPIEISQSPVEPVELTPEELAADELKKDLGL